LDRAAPQGEEVPHTQRVSLDDILVSLEHE